LEAIVNAGGERAKLRNTHDDGSSDAAPAAGLPVRDRFRHRRRRVALGPAATLGQGTGPDPEQLLAASVGNCLSASLLFALRKFNQRPDPITTVSRAEVGRNAEGRVRVLGLAVRITLGVPAAQLEHLERVLGSFETTAR